MTAAPTAALTVHGLVAGFGGDPVLRGVDLEVDAGTTTAVLGPSGCGKTTLLRAVAGFVRPDAGSVTIHGERVAAAGAADRPDRAPVWVPPERRPVGYVAQEGALFPHLSVADNVSFGLGRAQRRDRTATRARVEALLELVSLDRDVAGVRPSELSGGQQQRVALARALARRPRLVLLDEPFSALDAGLRSSTRAAVKEALAATGVTVVLVTHDQGEALSFADRVALVREGRVVQVDAPAAAYAHPVDRPAAEFLGDAVVLPGTVTGGVARCVLGAVPAAAPAPEGAVEVVLRPEQLTLSSVGRRGRPPTVDAARLGVVERLEYFGHDALVDVRLVTGERVRARVAGADLPSDGDVVQVEVHGPARTYPRAEPLPIS
ncbi:ABC transporter ATP-binding protein [Kineosporia sp. A_224]|uniref:ABC transporter ATP-binding protein n=1 Tax=Kineosporia sp. A_224 TaxID=1962180 RepID=UPI000B4B2B53|nr:ABC transporter ATP-binding protein [Kineosporia sp. A_224]